MRGILVTVVALALPVAASAQEMSTSERSAALGRVRALATCLQDANAQLRRVLELVRESEEQRAQARDERARIDAERAIETLIGRAATIQREARECAGGPDLPRPGTTVEVRPPPPDPNADSIAEPGNTVRTVETDGRLTETIRVVRGEQVDGEGRIEPSVIRAAVRHIVPHLARCYDQYLERGSIQPVELELEFTVTARGTLSGVNVARSGFRDARMDGCVRSAARSLRITRAPVGGEAIFGYRLRFGR